MYTVLDVLNNKFPCEGPRVVRIDCDFSTASTINVDLKILTQQGKINDIQSLFIDNSDNSAPLIILVSIQNQRIIIPAYSQAYITILSNTPQFSVSTTSAFIVPIFAQNFPVTNIIWNASAAGNPSSVNVSNFPVTQAVIISPTSSYAFDPFPGTAAANLAVTTVSASAAIAPTAGQNIRLMNNGANAVNIRMGTGAQTAVLTDLTLAPNQSILLNASGMTTLAAICATGTSTLNYIIGNGGLTA